jgi:hypothetical protein
MDDYFSAEETESEDDNNKKPSTIDSTQKMALPKMTVSEIVDAAKHGIIDCFTKLCPRFSDMARRTISWKG